MNAPRQAVLVTSATTALGRAVIAQLKPSVRVLGVRTPDEPAVDAHAVEAEVETVTVDLTRARAVQELLFGVARDVGVDAVVHLTARTSNVSRLRNLLDVAEEQPTLQALVVQSSALVYRIDSGEALLNEQHPLDFSPDAAADVRAQLEADVLASTRIGVSRLKVSVLRLAEILAPDGDGWLATYLRAPVCLRPLGYDPMLNVLSLDDAARAFARAVLVHARGIFNVNGADTLPLSELVHRSGRVGVALPGPWLGLSSWPWRGSASGLGYAGIAPRLHYSAIVDGRAAQALLGYAPQHPIDLALRRTRRA